MFQENFNLNGEVMKYFVLILTLLSAPVIAMESQSKGLGNPYVMAAGLGALSYYAPAFVQAALPENSIIPQALQLGGYTTAAYLAGFGYTNPLDLKKVGNTILTAGKKSLNLAPAVVCHPLVAHTAANACMAYAQPRVSENTAGLMQSYLPTALMVAGGSTAAYLISKNIITPKQAYKKTVELAHDAKPLSFLIPTYAAFNAEALKNGIMKHLPAMKPELNQKSGSLIKNTIIAASAIGAVHLFATEFLGLATQKFYKAQIDKLVNRMSELARSMGLTKEQLEYADQNVKALKVISEGNMKNLLQFSADSDKQITNVEQIHGAMTSELNATKSQVAALKAILKSCKPTLEALKTEISKAASKIETMQKEVKPALDQIMDDSDAQTKEITEVISRHHEAMNGTAIALRYIQNDQAVDLEAAKKRLESIISQMEGEYTALDHSLTQIAEIKRILLESAQQISDLSGGLIPVSVSNDSDESDGAPEATPRRPGGSKR